MERSTTNPRILLLAGILLAGLASASAAASSTSFLPVLGWEDDVDVVVAPDGEFLVLCEEREDGTQAQVRILNLAAATGQVLGTSFTMGVPGFENGVDPIIIQELEAGTGYPVLIPVESETGAAAGILVLRVNAAGVVLEQIQISLGPLGFRPDVDGLWTHYMFPVIAFFPLESEDHSIRGVLAIDADPRPAVGGGDFGGCTLLATAAMAACGGAIVVPWLPGLADAVDPVAYEVAGCCSRLALPVISRSGRDGDLLLIDFDPNFEPPLYEGHSSVKAINSAGPRPTRFPGFERGVDPKLFSNECGFGAPAVLVPVEDPVGDGDLYMLDQDGHATWTLSHDSGLTGLRILGYEAGVDLVPMCDFGGEPQVAVPLESASGTDADLWLVDLSDGHVVARAEDPAINPGLTIAGFEIGVDPVLWTPAHLVVPVEGPATGPGLVVLNAAGSAVSVSFGGIVLGFRRSVDPIVDRRVAPHVLYVPVAKDDASDADLLIFNTPPILAGTSVEGVNPGEQMTDFEWDVDPGLVEKQRPGGAFIYLPEEDATGANARLRIEDFPSTARVAMATPSARGLPSSLYFLTDSPLGQIVLKQNDLLGLETGLDMADGRGEISQDWQPNQSKTAGQDGDSDPTVAWMLEPTSSLHFDGQPDAAGVYHTNPATFPQRISYTLKQEGPVDVEVDDAAGRRVRLLAHGPRRAGEQVMVWDGLDDQGRRVRSGLYFLRIRSAGQRESSKIMVIR